MQSMCRVLPFRGELFLGTHADHPKPCRAIVRGITFFETYQNQHLPPDAASPGPAKQIMWHFPIMIGLKPDHVSHNAICSEISQSRSHSLHISPDNPSPLMDRFIGPSGLRATTLSLAARAYKLHMLHLPSRRPASMGNHVGESFIMCGTGLCLRTVWLSTGREDVPGRPLQAHAAASGRSPAHREPGA